MTNTTTTMVNRWPKLIPAKINNAQHQKQQNNKNRKRKRNSDANINNNRQKFTNDNFRQRQQNKPPMNQQQIQQSQHGQGKPSKKHMFIPNIDVVGISRLKNTSARSAAQVPAA